MRKLVVIAYDNVDTALAARATLGRLAREYAVTLDDIVVAERREDGKLKLHQTASLAGAGAAGGALWGGLIGLLFLAPVFGMAVGGAAGVAGGAMTDLGVDDGFMTELSHRLTPGGGALFVLFNAASADKVLPEMAEYGGEVLQTSLSDDAEQTLRRALASRAAAAAL